jgi:hypothetical protein
MEMCDMKGAHTLIVQWLFVFLLVGVGQEATIAEAASSSLSETIAKIVEGRELTVASVLELKQRFSPADEEYKKGRSLYVKTYAKYTAWVIVVKEAVRGGTTDDLKSNTDYKTLTSEATVALNDFLTYVGSVTGQPKNIFLIVSALVDWGIQIWNAVADRSDRERKEAAESFENDVKWKLWEEIRAPQN